MQGATKERWQILCEQAAVEQDPERLLELTREINRLLEEKQNRLANGTASPHAALERNSGTH